MEEATRRLGGGRAAGFLIEVLGLIVQGVSRWGGEIAEAGAKAGF